MQKMTVRPCRRLEMRTLEKWRFRVTRRRMPTPKSIDASPFENAAVFPAPRFPNATGEHAHHSPNRETRLEAVSHANSSRSAGLEAQHLLLRKTPDEEASRRPCRRSALGLQVRTRFGSP